MFVLQSLGNHEFDDGVKGLVPFINDATFPILASNLDLSKENDLNIPNLKNSVVFDLEGVKVAVIGYVTPDTKVRDYRVTKNCKTRIYFDAIIMNIRNKKKNKPNSQINILEIRHII
jgi:5'-nucleotidase